MFGVSGVFLYLNSDFLAAVQVLIYVGAVTVIIIFGISLTRNIMDERTKAMNQQVLLSILVALATIFIVICSIQQSPFFGTEHPTAVMASAVSNNPISISATDLTSSNQAFQGGAAYLGGALLKPENGFAFAFEFVSILLLSALVGAIVIARKDPQ